MSLGLGLLGAMDAQVKTVHPQKIKAADHVGVEVKASVADGKDVVRCRIVQVENRRYVLMVRSRAGEDVSIETTSFFASFQLRDGLSDK